MHGLSSLIFTPRKPYVPLTCLSLGITETPKSVDNSDVIPDDETDDSADYECSHDPVYSRFIGLTVSTGSFLSDSGTSTLM